MKKKAPTLADIARIVGVTPMVVSDVLKGRDDRIRASPTTQKKILVAAKKLHYRPNGSARAMRQNRNHNIGYLTVRNPDDYTIEAIGSGICDAANKHGYRVTLIKHLYDWNPTEDEIPSIYREAHLDALIVDTFRRELPPIAARMLSTGRLPIVYFNQKQRHNAVYVDDILGARLLTEHLLERGYRRISFLHIDYNSVHYSLGERMEAYRACLQAAGRTPDVVCVPGTDVSHHIKEWVRQTKSEAVICHNDNQTFLVQRALYELGRAPDSLAFAGFNGETLAAHSPVPLTTVRLPFFDMAHAVAEMAVQLGEADEPRPVRALKFEPELCVAASTLRAPALAR